MSDGHNYDAPDADDLAADRKNQAPVDYLSHPIYCYAPQRRAVVEELYQLGLHPSSRNPRAVDDVNHIRGLRGDRIRFIEIIGHPITIPADLMQALREIGVTMVTIDDRFARARYIRNGGNG